MATSFRITALPAEPFQLLFDHEESELRRIGARRIVVSEKGGVPCRVSLAEAEVGETVVLVPFTHHDVDSPYRASGPIFVRKRVPKVEPSPNEVPTMLRSRLLSVRGYDDQGMMRDAEVVEGNELEGTIERLFADAQVSYLHIHNARPGCYNCRVDRVLANVTSE